MYKIKKYIQKILKKYYNYITKSKKLLKKIYCNSIILTDNISERKNSSTLKIKYLYLFVRK